MPSSCSSGFKTRLASGSTQLGKAVRIVRKDGQVFAFTSTRRSFSLPEWTVPRGTKAITIPATRYEGRAGFTTTNLVRSDDVTKVDNWEASLTTGAWLPETDVLAGLFEEAEYTLLVFDWKLGRLELLLVRGTVGAPSLDGKRVTFKMRSLAQPLQNEILDVTSPLARATWETIEFFDPATQNTADGHVAQIDSTLDAVDSDFSRRRATVAASIGFPAKRFTNGRLTVLSGDNAGFVAGILDWDETTGALTLDHNTPRPLQAGDAVRLRVHVPLTLAEWILYFGTGFKFPGEPEITTLEQAAQIRQV